jgi:hypothetical protein
MNVQDLMKDNGKIMKQIKPKWEFDEVNETIGAISILEKFNNDLNKIESYFINTLCYNKKDVDLAMEIFYKVIKLFKIENEVIGLKNKVQNEN